jgi:DNA-binding HxlR family transcriptional regulator
LGDKWILVIVKLMLLEHKQTFKEFMESEEAIATNILSSKLKILEEAGLIEQGFLPHNKKTKLYKLSEKGLGLSPIIVELASWSDTYLRDLHPIIQNGEPMKIMRKNKSEFAKMLVDGYRLKVLAKKYNGA